MKLHMYVRVCAYVCECESYKSPKYKDVFKKDQELLWGIERSGFFNGRGKWAKDFDNQRV